MGKNGKKQIEVELNYQTPFVMFALLPEDGSKPTRAVTPEANFILETLKEIFDEWSEDERVEIVGINSNDDLKKPIQYEVIEKRENDIKTISGDGLSEKKFFNVIVRHWATVGFLVDPTCYFEFTSKISHLQSLFSDRVKTHLELWSEMTPELYEKYKSYIHFSVAPVKQGENGEGKPLPV